MKRNAESVELKAGERESVLISDSGIYFLVCVCVCVCDDSGESCRQ